MSGRIFQTLVALVLSALWAIALGYGHWRDELPFLDRAEGALTALRMIARGERPAPDLVTAVDIGIIPATRSTVLQEIPR